MNPDCRDGKHRACSGDGWDEHADQPCPCPCPCHEGIDIMTGNQMVAELRDILGARLVTYMASETRTSTIGSWCEGTAWPSEGVTLRLGLAHSAAKWITKRYSKALAQTWFQGMNDDFDDNSPAYVIRNQPFTPDLGLAVMASARSV